MVFRGIRAILIVFTLLWPVGTPKIVTVCVVLAFRMIGQGSIRSSMRACANQ